MRRVLFSVTERSGSSLLTGLLQGKPFVPGENEVGPLSCTEEAVFIRPTPDKHIIDDLIRKSVSEVPEAFMWNVPAVCDISFYDSLPGDFRFVYLLRDPRNRTESRVTFALDHNPNLKREDLFKSETNWCAAELRSVMQIKDDPRFMVVFFEDLIDDPVGKLDEIYKFCDLGGAKKDVAEKVVKGRIDNSSFGDVGAGSKERWAFWTKEEREHFHSRAGRELILFGFEKDDSWLECKFEEPKVQLPKVLPAKPKKTKIATEPLKESEEDILERFNVMSKILDSVPEKKEEKPVKKKAPRKKISRKTSKK